MPIANVVIPKADARGLANALTQLSTVEPGSQFTFTQDGVTAYTVRVGNNGQVTIIPVGMITVATTLV